MYIFAFLLLKTMSTDFSIESNIEKIYYPKTKEYFKEVYQTFVNGNYRSSTVMLYSVLICDFIYKLQELRDLYKDAKAKNILDDMEEMQRKNPNSPEWENKLIKRIFFETSLLESSDKINITHLQNLRHLSAHPVLTEADLLYAPNKEAVTSHIRNMLEGVFVNSPMLPGKIFDILLEDLSKIRSQLINYEKDLEIYLTDRYLKKLRDNEVERIFRSLWKIVFMIEDIDSIENREINFNALRIIFSRKSEICLHLIRAQKDYFSRVTEGPSIKKLVNLLAEFPKIFLELDEPQKLLINSLAITDGECKLLGWFINHTDLVDHLKHLNEINCYQISDESISLITRLCINNFCLDKFYDFAIAEFGSSTGFSDSMKRYEILIKPIIKDISLEQAKLLLKKSNENSQIFGCWHLPGYITSGLNDRIKENINFEEFANL
jgi:hypothetical protein